MEQHHQRKTVLPKRLFCRRCTSQRITTMALHYCFQHSSNPMILRNLAAGFFTIFPLMPRGEKYATLNRRFHKRNWGHKLAMFFVHLNFNEHHKFIIVSWRSTRLTTSTACQTSSIKSSKNRRAHPRIIEKKAVEPAHGRTTNRGHPVAGWRQA